MGKKYWLKEKRILVVKEKPLIEEMAKRKIKGVDFIVYSPNGIEEISPHDIGNLILPIVERLYEEWWKETFGSFRRDAAHSLMEFIREKFKNEMQIWEG